MWLFIISKPLEFIDTYIQTLRNFEIIQLHWVHHATVPLISAVYFHERTFVFVLGAGANCVIHTFMYAFFSTSVFATDLFLLAG